MIRKNLAQQLSKVSFTLIFIGSIFFTPKPNFPKPSQAPKADENCTYVIPYNIDVVDGSVNYSEVKPGDTLCLPAGIRTNIKFMNLHGVQGSPITIRNTGGKVVITGRKFLLGGIGLVNSSYIRVTGTGVSSKCGAPYSPEEQECGIEIVRTHKGLKAETEGDVGQIELDHLYIHHLNKENESRGIAIHPLDQQTVTGIYVHHNWIAYTAGEGIYLGSPPQERAFETLGKIEDVEVSYNLMEQIGFEGIEIKVGVRNIKAHHNVVLGSGAAGQKADSAGLKLVASIGDFYNNYIATKYAGIKMGRFPETQGTKYYNNIIIGAQASGIDTPEAGALIYNNTIISSTPMGINAPGLGSKIFDNIVAGTSGIPIVGNGTNVINNFTGSITSAGFVNPEMGDYRLLSDSPAVEAGSSTGIYPRFDVLGNRRPVGERPDLGAIEYSVSSKYLRAFCPPICFTYKPR